MDINKILPIVLVIGCLILLVIINLSEESFKGEYRESEIILPTPVPVYQYELDPKKDLIIGKEDKNNNFPINEKIIIDKPINNKSAQKDAPFADSNFIRDKGVENEMKKKIKSDDIEYGCVIDSVLKFNYPENSKDLLTSLNIKNLSKKQLDEYCLADLYDDMTAKVVNKITSEQIKSITGTEVDDSSCVSNLYKPIYVSIDKNLNYKNREEDIEYKFNGFNKPAICSIVLG
jgi:hypothetical protein